jgi:16S rRNA (guanine966-N2)-methyltransferase
MSMVHPWLEGARVLDLFAGSGALGLEALSRGAATADFVEQAEPSLRALHANIERLEAGDRARVRRADALRLMAGLGPDAYDIAFADPPYGRALAAAVAERWLAVPFASILGVEHGVREALPAGGATRQYGSTAVTIYRSPGGSPVGADEPDAGAAP